MNKLLQGQLREHFSGADKSPENFTKLLDVISESYDHYEKDRRLIERSIERSSKEMIELNNQVKKSGNDELQKVHTQLKTLLENIEEILYSVDMVSLKIVQISPACEKIYGYTPAEFFADRDLWIKVVLPEDIHIVDRHIKALYEGKRVTGQYRIIHKDKSIRWLESKIIPTLDAAGQLIRMDGVTTDISERKRAEKELEESVSILEATLESTADGILVTDFNGKLIRFNKKIIDLWHIPEEILQKQDQEMAIEYVIDQLSDPEEFLSKLEELNVRQEDVSLDTLKFKDGRIFERYSKPQLIKGKYAGRVWSFRDMTESKKNEDKIKESEFRYRSLIEQATDTICIIDTNLKFSDINPSGCRMFGFSKEEILQLTLANVLLEEDLKTNGLKINDLKSGDTIHNERRIKRKDGTLMEVELSGKMLEDGRILIFGRDISERKKTEKLIKESELRYRSLIEQATDAICIADRSMKFIDINPSGCVLLGYTKEEFLQLTVPDLLPIEDVKTNPLKLEELKSGKTIRNERKIIRKDGTIAEAEVSGKILEDGRFIIFGRDISERKQTEKLLKENELNYRNLIEQATDAICIADSAMKFIDVNPYACEFLGYSKEEALQLSVTDILFTEDLASNPFKFDDVPTNEIIRNERRFKRKDGTSVIMEVSTRLTEDGRFIMFGHDVSDRKKSEEALKESEKRLRQIIDLVPHFIFAKDAKGKFILANEAVARAYGCSVKNLIGKSDADFNSQKEEVEHFMQEDLKVINSGNAKYNIEETITDTDGNILTLSTTKIPYTTPEMDTPGILGVCVDITDRKKAEEQIKLSNERYELVIKTTNDMIWDWDLVNNTIFRNENYSKVFGADAADRNEVGKWVKQVHPDDRERVEEYIRQKVESPDAESWEVEFRYHRYNDEIAYLYDRGYIIRDENKKAIRMVGATSDITERKKAEVALIERDSQLTIATQIAKLGYWEFDVAKNLFTFNDQVYSIFKTTAEEVGGYNIASEGYLRHFVHPEDYSIVTKAAADTIKSPDPHYNKQIEHRIKYADGTIGHVATRFYIIKNDLGRTIKTYGAIQDITEKKNAEAALIKRDNQLTIATQIAKLGYWEFDVLKGLFTFNDQFYSIFKTTTKEIGGYTMAPDLYAERFVYPDDRAVVAMEVGNAINSTDPNFSRNIEHRFIYANGETGWLSVHFYIVKDNEGRTIKTFGVNQDITERKKAQEEISNNELRFRTLTANAPVGIFQTDLKGKTIYVNETWLTFTGMSFEEAMGDGWIAAVHADDRKNLAKGWNKKSRNGLKSSSEYRLVNKNGNNRWVSGEAVPLFNNTGEITGHIGTLSDITERKLAIESLQLSETKYRQIVETAQEGIWLIDEYDTTTFINKKMCEIVGYSVDELMGKKIYHFMDDESRKNAFEQIERRKQGISEIHDSVFVTKSGQHVWVNISTNPVLDEEGKYKGALAMMTNITLRKYHEELLRKSEASMELKNKELELKNKELEQFAYVASHDMQEPLRTTSSFVELLQKQYKGKLDEKADKYLNFIAQSSDRMKVLIKDLLDYSRIGRKKELAKVDCNIMMQEVLADLGAAIKETHAEIDAGPLPVINGYPTEIKQLFQNLVMNAIKFRKPGASPVIKITAIKNNDNWEFTFKDNGIGIEEQHSERIFIIFQRLHTRNEYEGSGIGLAHCKKIVELHGGKIWIDSKPGEGTAFHFTIRKNCSGESKNQGSMILV